MNIKCYDNGGKTADRYTVVYLDQSEGGYSYAAVGMSAEPFHPQGFGQHTTAVPGKHLGKEIAFDSLPLDCRKLVLRDLEPEMKTQNEVKHTPGPWIACHDQVLVESNNEHVCDCSTRVRNLSVTEKVANARLIAAAPDLLAALKDCAESLSRLPNEDGAFRVTVLQQARAAIAKAKL